MGLSRFAFFCLSCTKKTVRNNGETLFEVTVRQGCTAFYNCVDYFLVDNITCIVWEPSSFVVVTYFFLFFRCSCNSGFVMNSSDATRCVDINECLTVRK